MELELKRPSTIKVKIDGQVYEMKKLSTAEAMAIQAKAKELGSDEAAGLGATRALIVGRGIPEAVVDSLELELLQELVEALRPAKKN